MVPPTSMPSKGSHSSSSSSASSKTSPCRFRGSPGLVQCLFFLILNDILQVVQIQQLIVFGDVLHHARNTVCQHLCACIDYGSAARLGRVHGAS